MGKRKISLGQGARPSRGLGYGPGGGPGGHGQDAAAQPSDEVIELFFNSGVIYHEVPVASLPDVICSFKIVEGESERSGYSVRRAKPGEDPDVELSAIEHLPELSHRWLPCPYQLSCTHAVQLFLSPGRGGRELRVMLAIDTTEAQGAAGRLLDAALDAGRPFRPLGQDELGAFLDHGDTRELMRSYQKQGVERAPFKLAALLTAIAPLLPRIRLTKITDHAPIPVSLVLDLGNSRSSAVLVESHGRGMSSVPLAIRDSGDPFKLTDEYFGSRLTFLPSPFDDTFHSVATGAGFAEPSVTRLGHEALDRAMETPHRYACSISGPKRYLWDDRPTEDRWHFALKKGNEHRLISGRVLKHLHELGDGMHLREDGPSAPADPRYAPRAMMLFAMVEVLSQAFSQINSVPYRTFQGKEGNPRVLRHLVVTYPSAMRREELDIYETLVRNAVVLTCHFLNIAHDQRPNWSEQGYFEPFLMIDEAMAAQMVYVYQEIVESFSGSMEELARIYGKGEGDGPEGATLRVASLDLGGGTSDIMIAEYRDLMPGTGTALHVKKLFQDGISIAGDDVCKAIVEDIVLEQILAQLPTAEARMELAQLFLEGDAGHGNEWRTMKAKLVPFFWLPLARCFWSLAEGHAIPDHSSEKVYSAADVFRLFELPFGPQEVIREVDVFLARNVPGWPGFANLFFRFDVGEVEEAVVKVLREPLRKYADILAQFEVDLLVLAGRTSKLRPVRELLLGELPVLPPRMKAMADYPIGDWYPSKWRVKGRIKDPKSTVAAGAAVLHLATKNRLPGLLIEGMEEAVRHPIYGLYQHAEPHIARVNEFFREGKTSPAFLYTRGMKVGFRNVDSQEMDGSPLFEVLPASAEVEEALLEDRVRIKFKLEDGDKVRIAEVLSQRDKRSFAPEDFVLKLKTVTAERYWLDTGVLRSHHRHLRPDEEEG